MSDSVSPNTDSESKGSLVKATRLLQALAAAGSKGATVAVLAVQCEISRPTAHRICAQLQELGWIQRDNRKLFLGPELSILGLAAQHRNPLESIASPYLEEFSALTSQTVYLLQRLGDQAVCIARIEGSGRMRALLLEIGSRWPLGYGAAGMAILASLPNDEAEPIMSRNLSLLMNETEDEVRSRLEAARKDGFARHTGLILSGVSGLAAPVYDITGNVVAAVSVAYVADWMDSSAIDQCLKGIPLLANSISNRLGFEGYV